MNLDPLPDGFGRNAGLADQFMEYLASQMGDVVGQMVELAKRLGHDEGEEFAAGLRSVLHDAIDRGIRPQATGDEVNIALREITTYLESWVLSSYLDGSTDWHRQMADSEAAMQSADVGQPVTGAELQASGG